MSADQSPPDPAKGPSAVGSSAVGSSAVGSSAVGSSAVGPSAVGSSTDPLAVDPLKVDPLTTDSPSADRNAAAASLNPYAPTVELSREEALPAIEQKEPLTLARTAVRWFAVCGIAAIPSFFFGISITRGQISGMLMGIFLFAVGYTLLDYRTAHWPIRQRKTIRRTLRFTYGTRIAISLLFPIGMYLDLICGLATITLLGPIMGSAIDSGEAMTFFPSLLTTLVQGCVLNVVLGVYGLLILGVHGIVYALKR